MNQEQIQQMMDTGLQLIATYGLSVLGAIAILIVGWIASRVLAGAARKALVRAGMNEALVGFTSKLVGWAVMIFAVIAALNRFGVETTSFVAVMGAAGFAVGLALQGSLSNFSSGVLILVFRPFKIGDVIESAGSLGKVTEIGILATVLTTPDNQKIIIPNSSVMSGTIRNVTANDTRRVDIVAGISYSDDIAKAKQVLEEILTSHELVLKDPAPQVELSALADSSVNFVVRPWTKTEDYWRVLFDVTRAIKERFDANGISIPFPQRDVHLFQEKA